jgi:hypothetical protein
MTSIRSALRSVSALGLVAGLGLVPAAPQDTPRSPAAPTLQRFADGLTIGDLLASWTAETGRKFVVREDAGMRQRRISLTAPPQYAPADADYVFESMLSAAGLALMPAGPADAKLFVVEGVDQSSGLKARARFVPRDGLAALVRSPAQVFSTAIPLKHIKVESLRNAVSQVLTNRNVEFTMDIPSGNALYVVGFGPTLATIAEMIEAVDVAGAPFQEKPFEKEPGEKK